MQKRSISGLKLLSTKFWRRFSQLDGWLIQGLEKLDTPPLSVIHGFITPSTLDVRRSIVIYPNRNPRRRNSKPTHQKHFTAGGCVPSGDKKTEAVAESRAATVSAQVWNDSFFGLMVASQMDGYYGYNPQKMCDYTNYHQGIQLYDIQYFLLYYNGSLPMNYQAGYHRDL